MRVSSPESTRCPWDTKRRAWGFMVPLELWDCPGLSRLQQLPPLRTGPRPPCQPARARAGRPPQLGNARDERL